MSELSTHGLSNGCETLSHNRTIQYTAAALNATPKVAQEIWQRHRVSFLSCLVSIIRYYFRFNRATGNRPQSNFRGAVMEWKNFEKKLFTVNAINFIQFGQPNVVTHHGLKLLSIVDCSFEHLELKIELHSCFFSFRFFFFVASNVYLVRVWKKSSLRRVQVHRRSSTISRSLHASVKWCRRKVAIEITLSDRKTHSARRRNIQAELVDKLCYSPV